MTDTELLELMARMRIDLLWTDRDVEAMAGLPPHVQIDAHAVAAPSAIELLGDDPAAAARRAIQRCAALIEETQSDE